MADRVTAFAPGRVNLIGEHTDYNGGLALPFAISDGVTVAGSVQPDGEVHAVAADMGEEDVFALDSPGPADGWRAFVRGIVAELQQAGFALRGARLEMSGTVPRGAGLSSSAAVEVALALALLALAGEPEPDRLQLARICSKVENDWVGAQTGLLDQIASLCGQEERALRIDFRTTSVDWVELELGDHRLVLLDSGEEHSHAGSGYNRRREECTRACEMLGVADLSAATEEQARSLPEPLSQRARHVITENQRVDDAVDALARGDLRRLGDLLDASHASLRDCYEVSTPAVEAAVARLREAGAIGARIIGGGFGGHVLGLLAPGAEPPPEAIEVRPGPGARLLASG